MSRRFLHRWLGHWSLMLTGMFVILAVLLAVNGSGLLAGALITVGYFLALASLGWLLTRGGEDR